LGSRGGIATPHYFPVDGEYVIKLNLQRTNQGIIRGLNVANQIEIRVDGTRVGQFKIGGEPELVAATRRLSADVLTKAEDGLQVRIPVKAGSRQVVATILKSDDAEPEGLGPDLIPVWSRETDLPTTPVAISSLLIGGPYKAQAPQGTESRRLIYVCHPASSQDEVPCATKILSTLARRAYRRHETNDDVQALLSFYSRGRAAGNFDSGIRAALERLLVSPDFLYRIEFDPARVAAGDVYRIPDVELASRLSFFLWSSIPDDQLLDLAIHGKLREPAVLEQQVRRLLCRRSIDVERDLPQ
jgi:hypothetical protein